MKIGIGTWQIMTRLDLEGIDRWQAMTAVLAERDGFGTVFEVGYGRVRGISVVGLAQNMCPEDMKMVARSGCQVVGDLVSVIYHLKGARESTRCPGTP